jgi:hypothetical protein
LNHPRDGYRAYRSRRKRGLRRHGAHRPESDGFAQRGRGKNLPGSVRTGEIRPRRLQCGNARRKNLTRPTRSPTPRSRDGAFLFDPVPWTLSPEP